MKIVEQKKSFRVKNSFDYLNHKLEKYDKYFIAVKENHRSNLLFLDYLAITPWERVKNILEPEVISELIKFSSYKCPFNGFIHTSLVPITILTDTPELYIKLQNGITDDKYMPWYTDMAVDPTWKKDKETDCDAVYSCNTVDLAKLGPGFTEMFYPSDGSNYNETVGIELENGDIMLFVLIKWYNK